MTKVALFSMNTTQFNHYICRLESHAMTHRFFLLFFSLILSVTVFSQENNAADTTSKEEYKEYKKPHQDMLLVDLNWDYLMGLKNPIKQKWYGRGINVALLYDYPFTETGSVSGAIGGGFSSHNYYLNGLVTQYDTNGGITSDFARTTDSVRATGKFSINYVDVPLELRFRLKENDKGFRWKFAVGGRVGYLINAHEKIINNQDIKIKVYDYPNVTQWRYGVGARVGYGAIMVSGFYSLSPLFESGKSFNQYNGLQVGVTITPF